VDEDSVLLFSGYGDPQEARLVDLSQQGCRVRTNERITARVRLPVEVFFKVNGAAFRFRGVVQWTDGRNLLGIRFVNMIPRRMVELANVIREMEAEATARAEAVNRLFAERKAPHLIELETKERAEGLNDELADSAAKELPEAARPAVLAVPVEAEHASSKAPARRDRRSQTRHEVDTRATILLVKIGSTLRGRIVDLSLSGCRIRTDDRLPVGIYTRVETEFHLEGLPFRLGGVIQVIHDRCTVGIRFLDLSERKRQQVLELIGEIEQMRAAQMPAESAEDRI
jgi:c-di-GMP-binding flagellar brake protein YcgR